MPNPVNLELAACRHTVCDGQKAKSDKLLERERENVLELAEVNGSKVLRGIGGCGPGVTLVRGHALREQAGPMVGAQAIVEGRGNGLDLAGVGDGKVMGGCHVSEGRHEVGNGAAATAGKIGLQLGLSLGGNPFDLADIDGREVVGVRSIGGKNTPCGPPGGRRGRCGECRKAEE